MATEQTMASPCPSTSTVIEGDTINPGLEKQLDPYLVQFDEGDPLDPQVRCNNPS
jgi:hypothetical protein